MYRLMSASLKVKFLIHAGFFCSATLGPVPALPLSELLRHHHFVPPSEGWLRHHFGFEVLLKAGWSNLQSSAWSFLRSVRRAAVWLRPAPHHHAKYRSCASRA